MFRMSHPGILALLVGVAIGTAIYYYFNGENYQPRLQYASGESPVHNDNYRRSNNSNNNANSREPNTSRRRRRRNSIDTCTICFETIPDYEANKLNNCGHSFHSNCIESWLREKKECPLCRAAVI